jgi:hypothetical protein
MKPLPLLLCALLLAGCEREQRRFRRPRRAAQADAVRLPSNQPGEPGQRARQGAGGHDAEPFRANAYAVSQGKRCSAGTTAAAATARAAAAWARR